jgi:hypothetical protein
MCITSGSAGHQQPQASPSEPEANRRIVTDADWERLCRLIKLPPEAREELENTIISYKMLRGGLPPAPAKLRPSLRRVAEDAGRLATSLRDLSGRGKLIINMVREGETLENWNLGLVETLAGNGEFPPVDPGLSIAGLNSSKASGFLTEILEKITLLEGYAAAAAAAKLFVESKTSSTFAFIRNIDALLFKHCEKRVQRPSEKEIIKGGSTYPFVREVCELAGIETGVDDAIKAVTKMIGKRRRIVEKAPN